MRTYKEIVKNYILIFLKCKSFIITSIPVCTVTHRNNIVILSIMLLLTSKVFFLFLNSLPRRC